MMFESFNKVGSIEALEQRLKQLKTQPSSTGYWQKLSNECSKMSADQLNYLNTCEEVTQAKSRMMEAFNLYLFEKFKEEFSEQEMFRKFCDDYQDIIFDNAKRYSDSIAKTLDENKELRAKIQDLERRLNAKSNTKGT